MEGEGEGAAGLPRGGTEGDDPAWWANLELLRRHHAEHWHLPAHASSLGRWCRAQRLAHRGAGRRPLAADKVRALEAVPSWWWEAPDAWARNYDLLVQYVAEHQQLPAIKTVYWGAKLGGWCRVQRAACRGRAGRRPLAAARVEALEAVPGWRWEKASTWAQKFELLQQFVAERQHLPVSSTVWRGVNLGSWCHNQRSAYRGQGTGRPLTPAKIQALEAVPGWRWGGGL